MSLSQWPHARSWAERNVRPKAASDPYNVSAAAAPRPEQRPEIFPNCRVFRMHKMPIGPTGAAIAKPKAKPFQKNSNMQPRKLKGDIAVH